MNWEKLNMSQRSELMSIYLKNGITSLDEMKKHYNNFAEGGSINDPPYTQFLNTLPDNLKNSGDEYNMRRYWELNGYPKDFNEGIQKGMFTKQDDGYHANSVAFNPVTNSYEFMKDRNHPTYNMELDWYYSDDPEAVEFRKNYKYTPGIGMVPDQYTPRRFDTGGPVDPRRFFGIATPEVTDNTVYQPTYGTLLPEVKVAAFPGATDYDMARYKSGQLGSTTLDSIAKKRRTGQSQFMQDVNKLAWLPIGAMVLAGGFSGALANPYLWGAIGLSSAAQNIEDKNYGEAALDVGLTFLGPELQLINKAAEATRFGKSARIASELNKAVKSTRLQPKVVENPVHNLFYRKSNKPYLQEYIPTIEPSISDLFQIKGGLQRTADRLGTNINHYYNNVISPEEFMKLQQSVLPISEDFIQPRYIPSGFPYGLKESKILMPYDKMRQNPLFAKYKDLPDNEFKEVMDDLVGSHEFIHYHNNRIRKNILNNKYNPNMSEFQKHKLSYDGDKYFQGMSYPEGDYSNSYLLAGNGTEVNARLAQLYNIFNTNYLTPNEFHIAKRFYPSSILDNDMTTFFNRINDEEAFLRTANDNVGLLYNDGGPIHIKPENRGKFTALKKRTGHSASWFKENGTPAQKKMAVFELNSKKWRK